MQTQSVTSKEAADFAAVAYKELFDIVRDFDAIQDNAQNKTYAHVLLHANRQLLALYLMSADVANTNYISVIKNTACIIAFAYKELAEELGK